METVPELTEVKEEEIATPIPDENNLSTPSKMQKSPKCRTTDKDQQESDAIDPLTNAPLLSNDNNSSNVNANDYSSGDSEKDALILNKTTH